MKTDPREGGMPSRCTRFRFACRPHRASSWRGPRNGLKGLPCALRDEFLLSLLPICVVGMSRCCKIDMTGNAGHAIFGFAYGPRCSLRSQAHTISIPRLSALICQAHDAARTASDLKARPDCGPLSDGMAGIRHDRSRQIKVFRGHRANQRRRMHPNSRATRPLWENGPREAPDEGFSRRACRLLRSNPLIQLECAAGSVHAPLARGAGATEWQQAHSPLLRRPFTNSSLALFAKIWAWTIVRGNIVASGFSGQQKQGRF